MDHIRTISRPASPISASDALAACAGVIGIEEIAGRPRSSAFVESEADNSPRWAPGERLNHLLEAACRRFADRDAIAGEEGTVSFRDLDRRANQIARAMIDQGVKAGDRVGLLFDKSPETYAAMLATMKLGAAYVPFDPGFPEDRIRFILGDACVRTIVSMSIFEQKLSSLDVRQIFLDSAKRDIDAKPHGALSAAEAGTSDDLTCYIIYTSGTTGHPKGVAVEHPSICNFVRVASELYGYRPGDRVYQGMTIAFDFSIEEIWVPLMAGSTLVPGRPGGSLVGEELADFLQGRRVTAMACCPTLLATIERDLPELRLLLVGGEACPQNLVARWHRPGRTILNSYGPTEATVTATITELTPDKPVTIGKPLPTYMIVILDPVEDRALPHGEAGEIGIAGIGLAAGYVNREDLTRKKFIPDFLGLPNNPSARIYRTGDLGFVNAQGEIVYQGRIDTQVKIRGHRIELSEIEAVLLDMPQIAQAAVTTWQPEEGTVELVAYYALKQDAALARRDIAQTLRRRLPAYMVPPYLEEVPVIPMTLSNKADLKNLPKPASGRLLTGETFVAPKTDSETILERALADILRLERVSVEHHFFEDLGANSLLMARFCARIRQNPGMSNVAMRDIYQHPTIASLANHLDHALIDGVVATKPEPFHEPSDLSYYTCGALQAAFYACYGLVGIWIFDVGLEWAYAGKGALDIYLRSLVFAAGTFAALTALSIAGKWLLVGRFKAQSVPLWSFAYFRFWAAKNLIRSAPVAAFYGTPIFNMYLRALGAKIGRNVVIKCRFVPVCTDLISIGDNSILRKESILLGYRAQSNFIHTGPVEIGTNAFVGEASVLDIDTAMGDGAQLGHASSLQSGQRVPDGARYHGSPAVETKANYNPLGSLPVSSHRSAIYSAFEMLTLFAIAVPTPIVLFHLWDSHSGAAGAAFESSLAGLLLVSAGWFFGSILTLLAAVYAVPRLCQMFLTPGRVYPLFGLHYWLQNTIWRISNAEVLNVLFGDSSYIVNYMKFVGWKLNKVDQTGSNFGTNQRHDNPFMCNIGSGTMVSDGISMINVQMSSSHFQLCETKIGETNYLGNDIHYPPDGRTGANCLLATKVMIPIDGPIRENVGLLGSPCFEIPRMVERDREVNAQVTGEARRALLRRKNAHNLATMGLFLASRWMAFFAAIVVWHAALLAYPRFGALALFVAGAAVTILTIPYFALVERASLRFRRLTPTIASIYDPYFWSHERHWKLAEPQIGRLFAGTPFRPVILRMLGMKVGRKVFDASRSVTERTLAEVGDYANLNEGSVLQAHSLEEGVFKSDHIRIGRGCTLGPGAFVHYGVTMGEHSVLDADSFLMKGETLDPHTGWRGNPARMVRGGSVAEAGRTEAGAPLPHDFVPRLAAE